MKIISITPKFVEFIPSNLEEGVLYISRKYSTAAHKCCCGCGVKIVTPITPTDWTLMVVGDAVTLKPSIGNWNHPCQSHYWIRGNHIIWAGSMTQQEINHGRKRDRAFKKAYFERVNVEKSMTKPSVTSSPTAQKSLTKNLWAFLKSWLHSMFG